MLSSIILPSNNVIDPLRPLSRKIFIEDIAFNLARMPATCETAVLAVSIGQTSLFAANLFERGMRDSGIDPLDAAARFILLEPAWQYVLADVRVPAQQVFEEKWRQQLARIKQTMSHTIQLKFQLRAENLGKQYRFAIASIEAAKALNAICFAGRQKAEIASVYPEGVACLDRFPLATNPVLMSPDIIEQKYLEYFLSKGRDAA